jgi:hypothetical protein
LISRTQQSQNARNASCGHFFIPMLLRLGDADADENCSMVNDAAAAYRGVIYDPVPVIA